jgi:lysine-N-methylase
MDLPVRPRLAAHVVARRHIVDDEERIVLHDLTSGRLVQIGPREWGLLMATDGTRDLEGVVLAAAKEGAHARAPALRTFLEQLHLAGFLDDGVDRPEPSAEAVTAEQGDPALPLDRLAGYSLTCDGSGSCCRLYATIVFGPLEAARARVLLPQVLDGGERHERVFMPEHGSGPTGGAAVALRDGRCAYLAGDDRCGIHRAGGAEAKPVGCNTFPALFADDGERVRVSVATECACVLHSVDREGGSPLVKAEAMTRGDLDPTLVIQKVGENVETTPGKTAARAEFLAFWHRATRFPAAPDTARALFGLAAQVEERGLDPEACERAWTSAPPLRAEELSPWIAALAARAHKRVREDSAWRSERDLTLRAARWIAKVTGDLGDRAAIEALLAAPVTTSRVEDFYVRALLHGHRLVLPPVRPLTTGLRDRAVRMMVARALAALFAKMDAAALDPACAQPLALVDAMMRGHALDLYVEDVGR